MRSIFTGIEYAGKTTLIDLLEAYYRKRRRPTHNDDHFTIPDASLSPESRKKMLDFPDDIKERMQRMQIYYHVDIIKNYPHPLIGGWFLEEAVYCALYGNEADSPYYPGYHYHFQRLYEASVIEAKLPDVVLFHLTASDEVIRERMRTNPHPFQIIREKDIAELKKRFEEEVERSLFTQKGCTVKLDTTDKTPEQSLDELLLKTESLVTDGEVAMRAMPVPNDEYEVRYENGVRKTIPASG
ncbi:MAG: hypothetical protein FJY97_08665 [candidate division Zixibacteria bacterium]|nr:hypothetical protein [candidate division Zixibacteria bacterium]